MPTPYEQALNEFKDASAAVRLAFGAHSEARAAQIIANRNHASASDAYLAAQDRLSRADDALQIVGAEAVAPADIDASRPPVFGVTFEEVPTLNGADQT
jgi:hypothetical protein